MRANLRQCVWVLAALGTVWPEARYGLRRSVITGPGQDQDHSKNKNYQVGMRDGKDDKAHNREHSKKRKFKKDEDQKADEAGYQMVTGAITRSPRSVMVIVGNRLVFCHGAGGALVGFLGVGHPGPEDERSTSHPLVPLLGTAGFVGSEKTPA